jgi:hypothetical protein
MYRPYIDANNRVDTCKLLKFQKLGKKVRKTSKNFGHLFQSDCGAMNIKLFFFFSKIYPVYTRQYSFILSNIQADLINLNLSIYR